MRICLRIAKSHLRKMSNLRIAGRCFVIGPPVQMRIGPWSGPSMGDSFLLRLYGRLCPLNCCCQSLKMWCSSQLCLLVFLLLSSSLACPYKLPSSPEPSLLNRLLVGNTQIPQMKVKGNQGGHCIMSVRKEINHKMSQYIFRDVLSNC